MRVPAGEKVRCHSNWKDWRKLSGSFSNLVSAVQRHKLALPEIVSGEEYDRGNEHLLSIDRIRDLLWTVLPLTR